MTEHECPFCAPDGDRTFFTGERVLGLWDAFPVAPGHALLLPVRHVGSWFEATPQEQAELTSAIAVAKTTIEAEHQPDGYTIGVNVGRAAGQTVFHLHVHVIPRYLGDVPDPRGGVRSVIPGQANYLESAPTGIDTEGLAAALVAGGKSDPLLPHLLRHLDRAIGVDIAAAFTLESGVRLIEEHLRDVLNRGGRIRLITGDSLGVTEPRALLRLLDLQVSSQEPGTPGAIELRVFESRGTSFHPKSYMITATDGEGTAFVGSSNLTETALRRGIEWNYQVIRSRDRTGFSDVSRAFEELWRHPNLQPLTAEWIQAYQALRAPPAPQTAGIEPEPVGPPPTPHVVQLEALAALEETRQQGNSAGLIVMATGLGKTWLSAFDTDRPEYRRILFIAHREEILTQAMRTFRAIRPQATLGLYTGVEKNDTADVLFASIQTLGRRRHLERFDPHEFDYVVMDEFHHAAAQTYRRVIGHFEPKFLLGLTATPERTDGGDLLSLCGQNLVYRCDMAEGIGRGLLCPFDYFGVPDDVDYENIPWRSTRFDENALTAAVATRARAQNVLEQHQRHGGSRTIGFCVSRRHADYMAEFFRESGIRAVAVHSGGDSAPRAHSLERLQAGELDVVFAVDMFNEGVDLPDLDTVLMLRPTESRILWLQQFGRGLRYRPGKTLQVVDYIGNHRVFLTKARALFGLGSGDREVAFALDRLEAGILELPPGCSVTYELEAKEMLRSLLRTTNQGDVLNTYYEQFRELNGVRPLASEAYQDGVDPKSARRGFGSWLGFVHTMEDLTPDQVQVRERLTSFLEQLEVTPMTRSYKMLVLLAMLDEGAIPGSITIERLTERFTDLARRHAGLRTEVGNALEDPTQLRRLIITNPVEAWTGGAGMGGVPYFHFDENVFSTTFSVPDDEVEALQDLVREIAEWRLAVYIRRTAFSRGTDRFLCRVSHSDGRPILFLPNRDEHPGLPEGWHDILADDEEYQANFVKIAVNVVTGRGSTENVLPELLRRWFGPDTGRPGRTDQVVFERAGAGYVMVPLTEFEMPDRPVLWERYTRQEAAEALGMKLRGWEPQSGVVRRPEMMKLMVTLEKDALEAAYQYRDRFLSPTEFQWQSQNRTTQESESGQEIRLHREKGLEVHLFVRRRNKSGGQTLPFIYCGTLDFERWEGERPITVWWRLREAVPESLWGELKVPLEGNSP